MKNKIEAIVFGCFGIGIILTYITKIPLFVLTTLLSIPICMKVLK